jgi:hypothetical protein
MVLIADRFISSIKTLHLCVVSSVGLRVKILVSLMFFFSHGIFYCLNWVQFKHVVIVVDIIKYIMCRQLHISTRKSKLNYKNINKIHFKWIWILLFL